MFCARAHCHDICAHFPAPTLAPPSVGGRARHSPRLAGAGRPVSRAGRRGVPRAQPLHESVTALAQHDPRPGPRTPAVAATRPAAPARGGCRRSARVAHTPALQRARASLVAARFTLQTQVRHTQRRALGPERTQRDRAVPPGHIARIGPHKCQTTISARSPNIPCRRCAPAGSNLVVGPARHRSPLRAWMPRRVLGADSRTPGQRVNRTTVSSADATIDRHTW